MKSLKKLIDLAKHKNKIDINRGEAKFMDSSWLLQSIAEEIKEVEEEMQPNNIAHLEDELSDILWGWLVLVEKLRDSEYVESHEAIMKRALKKYEERILPLKGTGEDHAIWKEVKHRQKIALEEERSVREFRYEVREFYKHYYENSDKAHLLDHPDDVCDLALHINKGCDERLVILASYLHDMFNREARDIHNELAYEYVLKSDDKFLIQLSKEERLLVAHAVLEHRGEFSGEFFSKLSELISSADRGLPDLDFIVRRSMKFNHEDAYNVFVYVQRRYGTKGYANYPDVYREVFGDELLEFQKLADELTVERVLEIWEKSGCE